MDLCIAKESEGRWALKLYVEGVLLRLEESKDEAYLIGRKQELTEQFERERARVFRKTLDFTAIYERYPKKVGKKSGMEYLQKTVKEPAVYQRLERALENYKFMLARDNTEMKYILLFSSFVRRWQDYEDVVVVPEFTVPDEISEDELSEHIQQSFI